MKFIFFNSLRYMRNYLRILNFIFMKICNLCDYVCLLNLMLIVCFFKILYLLNLVFYLFTLLCLLFSRNVFK